MKYVVKRQKWLPFKQFLAENEKNSKYDIENGQNEWTEIEPTMPSLYPYYETLPKIVREANTVKTVFMGFEHFQPDFTYQQKEDALNEAAYMALPFDNCILCLYFSFRRSDAGIHQAQPILSNSL